MKKMIVVLLGAGLCLSLKADNNPNIDECLKAWGKHPFNAKNYTYKKLKTNVKVLGIGGNIADREETAKPQLVLINHSVSVLSKQKFELLNPNGWYCIRGSTAVLGQSEIHIHCKAHLASTVEGAAVLGNTEDGAGSVAVLGKSTIEKVGCESKTPEPKEKEEKKTESKEETPKDSEESKPKN